MGRIFKYRICAARRPTRGRRYSHFATITAETGRQGNPTFVVLPPDLRYDWAQTNAEITK
jgi:hypothetical protein